MIMLIVDVKEQHTQNNTLVINLFKLYQYVYCHAL